MYVSTEPIQLQKKEETSFRDVVFDTLDLSLIGSSEQYEIFGFFSL